MSDKHGSYIHILKNNSKNIQITLTLKNSLISFIQDLNHLKLYKTLEWDPDDDIIIVTEQGINLKIHEFYDSFNCVHHKYELINKRFIS
jgi:hypothetical protein